MATPSQLEQKHVLLSAIFPGIQIRRMSRLRYLERKEDARRAVSHKRQGSLPNLHKTAKPAEFKLEETAVQPSLKKLYCRARPKRQSVDLSCTYQRNYNLGQWKQHIGAMDRSLAALNTTFCRASFCCSRNNVPR